MNDNDSVKRDPGPPWDEFISQYKKYLLDVPLRRILEAYTYYCADKTLKRATEVIHRAAGLETPREYMPSPGDIWP